MSENNDYIDLMSRGIRDLVRDALKISIKKPFLAQFILQTIYRQKQAGKHRLDWKQKNMHVSLSMIISITSRCNQMQRLLRPHPAA